MSGDWRDPEIAALDERVRLVGEVVAHLLAAEAMFEHAGDNTAATETRGYAALLRDRAAGFTDQARKLRAEREPVTSPLPMVVTRRRVG